MYLSKKIVLSPEEVKLKNSKVRSLQILASCNLPYLKTKIITPAAFEEYYQKRKITSSLSRILKSTLETLFQKHHLISIRTSVEKRNGLLLPRSGTLDNLSSALQFIQKTWDFFIKKNSNPNKLGVALLVHQFVPSFAAGTLDSSLPQKKNLAMIEATYGIWEGIQSNLHDVYIIDKRTLKLHKKIIPEKDFALFPTSKNKWKYKSVPNKIKSKQVISNLQIEELIRQTKKIEAYFGPARIEFILKKTRLQKSKKAVLLWHITRIPPAKEVLHYKVEPLDKEVIGETVYTGYLFAVDDTRNIRRIRSILHPRPILYLSGKIIAKRNLLLIQQIARLAKEKKWPILYKGGQLTHISIILREYGITVYPVNQNVELGKEIRIVRSRIG